MHFCVWNAHVYVCSESVSSFFNECGLKQNIAFEKEQNIQSYSDDASRREFDCCNRRRFNMTICCGIKCIKMKKEKKISNSIVYMC